MVKEENEKKSKVSNNTINRIRRIKKEVGRCEKKLVKLLDRFKSEKLRWKLNKKGNKIELELRKFQGIVSGSKRHNSLLEHIKLLKSKI